MKNKIKNNQDLEMHYRRKVVDLLYQYLSKTNYCSAHLLRNYEIIWGPTFYEFILMSRITK